MLSTAKKQVELFREQYEQLLAEDKEQDRFFKRDFADCEPYTDQLYKLFRKRPRCAAYIRTYRLYRSLGDMSAVEGL